MAQTTVGIRELKEQLARYIRQVKAGNTLVITERGKPVGRIVPVKSSTEERMQELIKAGVIEWSGRNLKPAKPSARLRGTKTLSDLVLENRD
ncbi:MAG: type II toxin-antitoxin system prevent-host-death family antitoxin [Chloroflexi bacterium]|nr:type II toxin-antitoxin system prevent-host-death family antitoxin [Chloroflexota bacterium]